MKEPFKILIVDDHPMFAFGTKTLLEQMEHVQIVGIAETGKICLEYVNTYKPDLVLLDFKLPDQTGYEIAKQIHAMKNHIKVVLFTGIDVLPLYNELLDLHICGILAKNSGDEKLRNMVRCIMEGQTAVPLEFFQQLRLASTHTAQEMLTKQEMEIMAMLTDGQTQDQIAENLFTSKRSVDNYLRRIYEKLGAKNKSQAIQKFVEMQMNTDVSHLG
ncbi:response regulator transcription factor [Paenibacillus athensensis]|uniref:Uncharacterized protein n=1 Tax=Paenibacillus athensensis TaxID=1967502 RepID=A0A4Y8PSD2_9BACL|nr:response regulator transcription factor [Paenibacillus athensensis]MCD1261688.1 response regulator transcription factor [Paenibacillus athensensis]